MKLSTTQFAPLEHAAWIMNAVVDVKPFVNLSISYGSGGWYVGDWGSFEVAVQLNDYPYSKYRCLVALPGQGSNVIARVTFDELDTIFQQAMDVSPKGMIEVFDEGEWKFRFFTDDSDDAESKLRYAMGVYGKDKVRHDETYFAKAAARTA